MYEQAVADLELANEWKMTAGAVGWTAPGAEPGLFPPLRRGYTPHR
jgi:hypothetical protein